MRTILREVYRALLRALLASIAAEPIEPTGNPHREARGAASSLDHEPSDKVLRVTSDGTPVGHGRAG